ncbi:hypothetical protein LTR12_015161 [Friedmanniomyces endolithicus]|nr:hypothetical protein LTR12_015161 [Friedmanniomyces endolithicus]
MNAALSELGHLLRVLDERDIPLGQDDVAWAFDHHETKPEIASWVQEYLYPPTLLTKEELHYHNAHPDGVENHTGHGSPGRPLSDSDFEAAIASLEASTAAIDKQCQLLETQKQALTELKARNASRDGSTATRDRQKKLVREKAQLDFAVDELADALQSKLQTSSKQIDATVTSLPLSIDRILEKDDRILDGLQKLLPKLSDTGADQDVCEEVDRLCQALTVLSAQEIRLRMDDAYRASAGSPANETNGQTAEIERERQSLRLELDELSQEIDSLATMAVDGQFRVPLLRELQTTKSEAESDRSRWSEYVAATLQYLTTRLVALEQHSQHMQTHQRALVELTSVLETTTRTLPIAASTSQHTRQAAQQTAAPRSPATPTSSAKGLKPLHLVRANLSEPQDHVAQLLRSFEIRAGDTSDIDKLTAVLELASKSQRTRLTQLRGSTECGISEQLVETVGKADGDVEDLLQALYAHSIFGTVRLVDPEVADGLARLERQTQGLGEEMRGLDVEGIPRLVRERQREVLG